MIKFALIDDDKKLLNDFYKMLESIFIKHDLDAKVVFYSTNVVALLNYVKESKVDVLFLDIDLKSNLSGLELLTLFANLLLFKDWKNVFFVFLKMYLN